MGDGQVGEGGSHHLHKTHEVDLLQLKLKYITILHKKITCFVCNGKASVIHLVFVTYLY